MAVQFTWDGLGLPHWDDVVRTHARVEPCRPLALRALSRTDKESAVLAALGLSPAVRFREVLDVFGRQVFLTIGIASNKIATNANHASYAGWIEDTLRHPLEVWRRADDGPTLRPEYAGQIRDHFFGAYAGPGGVTSFMLVAVTASGKFINAFTLTSTQNANNKRYGDLVQIGYDPHADIAQGPLLYAAQVH